MSKLTLVGMLMGLLFGGRALAVEWVPIKQGEDTVREIDAASIKRNGPLVDFVARHTFADKNEYNVGRREVKYLLITSRANCDLRTLDGLVIAAYDEKMDLISKQENQLSPDNTVTRGSIDESSLEYVCSNRPHKNRGG